MLLAAATTFHETLVPAWAAMPCTLSPAVLSVSGVTPTEAETPAEADAPAPAEAEIPADAEGRQRRLVAD